MFWRVAGFTQPSPVETLLDKGTFTLEELLDEDDLIQARASYISYGLLRQRRESCVDLPTRFPKSAVKAMYKLTSVPTVTASHPGSKLAQGLRFPVQGL